MSRTKASPPPSPSTLLKAQIMVVRAAQKKAKAKKATKSDAEKENKGKKAMPANGKVAPAPAGGQGKENDIHLVSESRVSCIQLTYSTQLGEARESPLHQHSPHSNQSKQHLDCGIWLQ